METVMKRKTNTGERYLTFGLEDEEYCIEILKVKEIMGMQDLTKVPQTPAFIKGVINLRGQIIPIIDLRIKFEFPFKEYTDRTCIIVVELMYENENTLMGMVVDTIKEVVSIPQEKISKVPYINSKIKADYITGIAETNDGVKIVLDIDRVLTGDDFVLLSKINKNNDNNIKIEDKEVSKKNENKS